MARNIRLPGEAEKMFYNHIKELSYSRATWQVWDDVIRIFATMISNPIDKVHFDARETRKSIFRKKIP